MAFSLYNNLISNKIREEMYLKHLREVQKINNREADSLKKQLQEYKCVSAVHRQHKQRAKNFRASSKELQLSKSNQKITNKILNMSSDQCLKQKLPHPNLTQALQKSQSICSSGSGSPRKPLHYRYRKKLEEQIDYENAKLSKAILSQKSNLLPQINPYRKNNNDKSRIQPRKSSTGSSLTAERKIQ